MKIHPWELICSIRTQAWWSWWLHFAIFWTNLKTDNR